MAEAIGRIDRPVLLDNTVLTNLALTGQIGLVKHLWPHTACTVPQVLDEYRQGAASGLLPADDWRDLPVVTLTKEEQDAASDLSTRLGAGERACLAVALHRHGLFVSDDRDARRAAEELGIAKTGTIGILLLCVRRGHLSLEEANALLTDLIELGYRSPVDSLNLLLDES
jgi:predicted nucleic acid-binding protein